MSDRYKLNETRSPIDPSSWRELNQNWDLIQSYLRFLERQIKFLAGGKEIDEILIRIDTAIENAENATGDAEAAKREVENALQQLEVLVISTQNAANNANNAARDANTLNTALTALKRELETLQTNLNSIVQSEAQRLSAENTRRENEAARSLKEQARESAEQQRNTTFDSKMTEADEKTATMQDLIRNLVSYSYAPETTYVFPNLVKWNGSTFIALRRVKGITPVDDGVNYRLVAKKGDKGDTGAGINVLGRFNDTSELPTTGSIGDAYIIGINLYVWGGTDWVDGGPIQGPKGDSATSTTFLDFVINASDSTQVALSSGVTINPTGYSYNANTDTFEVYRNSRILYPGSDYTIENGSIRVAQSVTEPDKTTFYIRVTRVVYRIDEDAGRETIVNALGYTPANNTNLSEVDQRLTTQLAQKAEQREVDVLTLGVKGDGVTNELPLLNNIVSTLNTGDTLYFPNAIGYRILDTLNVPENIHIIMESPLIGDFHNKPILVVGNSTVRSEKINLNLQVRRLSLSDWEDENSKGISLINFYDSKINIIQSSRNTIGVEFLGDGNGLVYNEISLGNLYDNKIHLDCTNINGGWCNENIFIGGRLSNTRTTHTSKSRYGVRITSKDGKYVTNNNNIFIKPSIELQSETTAPESLPILVVHGEKNHIFKARNESNTTVFAQCENASNANDFITGYGQCVVRNVGTAADNFGVGGQYPAIEKKGVKIFDSGHLSKKANIYNGVDSVYIPGMHIAASNSANLVKSLNGINILNDSLEISSSRAIGVVIDTAVQKQFNVRRELTNVNIGRVMIRCYDENGNILNDSDVRKPHIKSTKYDTFTFYNYFGGVYRNGSDSALDKYFVVGDHVKKVVLLIGGALTQIKSFQVESLKGHATVWSGLDGVDNFNNYASAPPTSGTYNIGKTLINDVPTELGSDGSKYIVDRWRCIAAGTPGVWVENRISTGN